MRTAHLSVNAPRRAHPRQLVPATFVAVGATAGLLVLTAPAAYALPESQIKSECEQGGGHYETTVRPDGSRVSVCCPTGAPGEIAAGKCSIYVNGELSAMQGGEADPTSPVVRPPRGPIPTAIEEPPVAAG
ncbi:MAG: hypothetical protein QJR12_04685 [Mycobacterium sp.]|uniref:hypothetical protein n=1 Tax=Mycobacterium sp. TaxID=1785 RepID=UPI0026153F80|nr:hypothetical protein [Mycobacterium sp.]MDI3313592.1 hypothetical protein [Mycobacterium sp.]